MKNLVERISSAFSRVASLGICSILPYLSGCVEPPMQGQSYTKEELEEQQTKTAMLRAGCLLFGLAGINAPTPVDAARAAVVAQGANYLADDQSRIAAAQVERSGGKIPQEQQNQSLALTPLPHYVEMITYNKGELIDSNGNGKIEYEEIISKKKNLFGVEEPITLSIRFPLEYSGKFNYKFFRTADSAFLWESKIREIPNNIQHNEKIASGLVYMVSKDYNPFVYAEYMRPNQNLDEFFFEGWLENKVVARCPIVLKR